MVSAEDLLERAWDEITYVLVRRQLPQVTTSNGVTAINGSATELGGQAAAAARACTEAPPGAAHNGSCGPWRS